MEIFRRKSQTSQEYSMEYGAPKHFPPKAPCSMSLEVDFILEISFLSLLTQMIWVKSFLIQISSQISSHSNLSSHTRILMEAVYLQSLITFNTFNDNSSITRYVIFGWSKLPSSFLEIHVFECHHRSGIRRQWCHMVVLVCRVDNVELMSWLIIWLVINQINNHNYDNH